jgi:hypothetical protein
VDPERSGRGAALVIHGVVPNPSLDHAVLSFSLAREGHVRLDVFDLSGRRLATPLDGVRSPGRQEVDLGAGVLDAGVYYYRVRFEDRVRSGKFVRVR